MKTARLIFRIDENLLDAFDKTIEGGNRSKEIRKLMYQKVIKSNKFKIIKDGNSTIYIED